MSRENPLHVAFRGLALDPRSLAVFRVGLASFLIFDLVRLWQYREEFYGPKGVLDFETWTHVAALDRNAWTLHQTPGPLFDGLVVAQIAMLLCVFFGYRVRLFALAAWILQVSLVWRNPLLMYGGEKLVALLLLGLAFAVRTPGRDEPSTSEALGGLLVRSQMVITYVASGLAKVGKPTWMSGDALVRALHLNELAKPVGVWLGEFDSILRVASWTVPYFEVVAPFFLLAPPITRRLAALNGIALVSLLGLNLGIFLTLDVGYFMAYATTGFLALVPPQFWESRIVTSATRHLALPKPSAPRRNRLGDGARAVACLALVLLAWVSFLEGVSLKPAGTRTTFRWAIVRATYLHQDWGLFDNPPAPRWHVAKAKLRNGTFVDLLELGGPVDYRRPSQRRPLFVENFRWRLVLAKGQAMKKYSDVPEKIARGLAYHWDRSHPPEEHVASLVIYRLTARSHHDPPERRSWTRYAVWEAPRMPGGAKVERAAAR